MRRAFLMKTGATGIAGMLIILCNGCLMPPILYPRTGGQGVIVDQYDEPVPNAKIEASWFPKWFPEGAWIWFIPKHHEIIHAKEDGSWNLSVRKVNMFMRLKALPSKEYLRPGSDEYYTEIPEGTCRTNIVLRLIKIETPSQPKESK